MLAPRPYNPGPAPVQRLLFADQRRKDIMARSKLAELSRFEATSRAVWRSWLKEHHMTSDGVWLVTAKKSTGLPRIDYNDAVEELLCFGWVDSLTRGLDDTRSMLLCTPRNPKSNWSRHNKRRIKRLEAAGLVAERGREVVELARQNGAWEALDAVEELVIPEDLEKQFRAHAESRRNWETFPRGARRAILEWISAAKRPGTRAARVEQTALLAAQNVRVNQWRQQNSGGAVNV